AGHPESFLCPGVEATTGPLGQGVANAVGMAMAERRLAHLFNRPGYDLIDHHTYAFVSDGDLMEGIASEAGSLAGHLKLGKLIFLYDANDISLDGPTDITFNENVMQRFESFGWHVQRIEDGDKDLDGMGTALRAAKAETERPSFIELKTTIGYGSPNKAGTSSVHGSPLGDEELEKTKENLEWGSKARFFVPDEVRQHMGQAIERGQATENAWQEMLLGYSKDEPELAKQWHLAQTGQLPEGWQEALPVWDVGQKVATRSAGGKVLNALAKQVDWLFGGDADLSCSTKTALSDGGSFTGETGAGRNIHYGVREHAMASISNGMAYHGGLIPFNATFFCFADYMRPALRLAALSGLPTISVWTHDSIGLGEDGPTHQPVEHLMSLRVMPNFTLLRPADANETAGAWAWAMQHREGPSGLVLSRQDLPVLAGSKADQVAKGAYVLEDHDDFKVALLASGSEVALCMEVAQLLKERHGIVSRIISMPSWELFSKQDDDYQDEVLPDGNYLRVSVEAGVSLGWERWIGSQGLSISIETFGLSAPADACFAHFGFEASLIAEKILAQL
ncbi:MAG: transketolase, partial [Myxococcota bacterium]|nr:transketolase [Myxococcota bacterium]